MSAGWKRATNFFFLYEKKGGSRGRGKSEIKKGQTDKQSLFFFFFLSFLPFFAGLFLAFACVLFRRFSTPCLANETPKAFVSPLFSCGNFLFENISEHPLICLEKFF